MPENPESGSKVTFAEAPKKPAKLDGDVWVEAKAILDESTGKTRSYFWSKNTRRRVWDKPPSDAGKVIYMKDLPSREGRSLSPERPKRNPHAPQRRRERSHSPVPKDKKSHGHGFRKHSKNKDEENFDRRHWKEEIAAIPIWDHQGSMVYRHKYGTIDKGGGVNYRRDSLPPPDNDFTKSKVLSVMDTIGEDSDDEDYHSQKSKHVKGQKIIDHSSYDHSEDSVWVEARVLINSKTGKTRSYFANKKTGRRVWDEPPSGAKKIIYLKDVQRVYVRERRERRNVDTGSSPKKGSQGSTNSKSSPKSSPKNSDTSPKKNRSPKNNRSWSPKKSNSGRDNGEGNSSDSGKASPKGKIGSLEKPIRIGAFNRNKTS